MPAPTLATVPSERALALRAALLRRLLGERPDVEALAAAWQPARDGFRSDALLAMLAHALGRPGATHDAAAAFAQACLAQARADIAREARRAGHDDAFDALAPWLERQPDAAARAALALALRRSDADVVLALARLRRRFRQRVDGELAAWAPTAQDRDGLRRALHGLLTGNAHD